MFDIGWSEFVLIAVVALVVIGPKELPAVLRMVGQWMGKARKMAAEFQGQFQEAMREAEMADLKKSFDEVKEAASGFASGNIMTSLQKDVSRALDIEDVDKPTEPLAAIEPPVLRPPRRKRRRRKPLPKPIPTWLTPTRPPSRLRSRPRFSRPPRRRTPRRPPPKN